MKKISCSPTSDTGFLDLIVGISFYWFIYPGISIYWFLYPEPISKTNIPIWASFWASGAKRYTMILCDLCIQNTYLMELTTYLKPAAHVAVQHIYSFYDLHKLRHLHHLQRNGPQVKIWHRQGPDHVWTDSNWSRLDQDLISGDPHVNLAFTNLR